MSNVLVKDRQISEIEYLNTAMNIKITVTQLVMNEKVIPKKYRFVYSIPIIDKCRELVENATIYDDCKGQVDVGSDCFIYNRKREALLNMLDACKYILRELACARAQYYIKISRYERVVEMIVGEEGLIKHELENITKKFSSKTS